RRPASTARFSATRRPRSRVIESKLSPGQEHRGLAPAPGALVPSTSPQDRVLLGLGSTIAASMGLTTSSSALAQNASFSSTWLAVGGGASNELVGYGLSLQTK